MGKKPHVRIQNTRLSLLHTAKRQQTIRLVRIYTATTANKQSFAWQIMQDVRRMRVDVCADALFLRSQRGPITATGPFRAVRCNKSQACMRCDKAMHCTAQTVDKLPNDFLPFLPATNDQFFVLGLCLECMRTVYKGDCEGSG